MPARLFSQQALFSITSVQILASLDCATFWACWQQRSSRQTPAPIRYD